MTTSAGDDTDDDPRRAGTHLLRASTSPSENWDDDFEFQAGAVASARDNAHDAMNAPTRPGQSFEQEESWDDAYEDDNTHSSPIKRPKKAVDDDVEDWDSSDNELETHDGLNHDIRRSQTQEFGFGGFEEEDKTVTARSTSSKPREPPPALPLPIPPSHSGNHVQAHTVLPSQTTSPTLSTFSIPLSSTTRDRASIYSQDPLMPASNSSAPHLSVMRSYPHAAGSTPPRRGRRLRKKSRPPEADIFELEDRELDSVPGLPASILPTVNVPQLDIPPPTTPPRAQQLLPESPSQPLQPSAPPTPSSSLLTRIGSLKRWARRSMGPDDPALSGWRRAKSSIGPSEAQSSHGPGEVLTHGGKSSTAPEVRTSIENGVEHDLRAVSPTPAPGGKARRSRGESASGLKSGWFFRAGGAAGSEKDDATPTVQTLELTPSKRATTLGLRRRNKEPAEDEDGGDGQRKTPTPRKAKGKLVPALKGGGSGGFHKQGVPKSPTRSSKRPISRDGTDSLLHNESRPRSMLFPVNGSASMGRNAGLPVSTSVSAGPALLTSTRDSPGRDDKVHRGSNDKDSGMRGLMNGVRRLSLVGAGHTHKRTKSTGGGDGPADAARKDKVVRPRSQTDHYSGSKVDESISRSPIARLGSHQHVQGLLPPAELESPVSGLHARRGSFPWADYDHLPIAEFHAGVSFAGSAHQPPKVPDKHSQHRQSLSTSSSSLPAEVPEDTPGSGSLTKLKQSPIASASLPIPVPTAPDAMPRSRPSTSTTPAERRPGLESRQAALLQPHSQSQSPQPSTPQSASLGRSTGSPSHSAGLRRNSLGDLKTPLNALGEHKAQLPPLSELKIPARISRAQQGLRRDMGMVKEFAGCVEQLKRLQATYIGLLGNLRDAYEASLGSPAPTAAQVQFHLPSRPPSQIGNVRKGITSNSNPSVQRISSTMSLNSPTQLHPARSFSRASHEISRELVRLEHEYGIWWECAELLVELGGGSGVTSGSASNPNLATQSTSTLYTPAEELLKLRSSEDKQVIPRPITHVSSMSEPGSLFEQATLATSNSKGPPQASPPHPSQWRASTGRHDLSARQLRLLKDMLNTPNPASFAYAAGPYGYGVGYPYPHSHPHTTAEVQPWAAWNPSAVTLPSDESSADAHGQSPIAATETRRECKEKKRRASRLGMLGLREILRGLKRNAVAEGRLSTGDELAHGPQGSESSMSNGTEDDHYNRRRSPWHQHDEHHVTKQSTGPGPELNVAMDLPPPRNLAPKSPRRPSLASIFRIGNKNAKNPSTNGKSKDASPNGNGASTTEDERVSGLVADGIGDYSDWERMSRSDLDLAVIGSGTATVRAKKNMKTPVSHSSANLSYPYSNTKATTPKRMATASQTSLWDSSPSSATSPQPSRLPLSIAEEAGGKHPQNAKTPGISRSNERTSLWSQAHPPRPTSRSGKVNISGTVRSAPPTDFSSTPDPKLALTPENIKPLLEYAKEVGTRLSECISEVQILLGASTKAS